MGRLAPLALAVAAAMAAAGPGASAAPLPGAAVSPAERAAALFQRGEYAGGLELLNTAYLALRGVPGEQARVLAALAQFYERFAGDHSEAERHLTELVGLGLPPGDPLLAGARSDLQRLGQLAARFHGQDEVLARAAVEQYDLRAAGRQLRELEELAAASPEYPRLASVYYQMGRLHALLDRQREALADFDRALALKPALSFHLPVEYARLAALQIVVRRALELGSRAVPLGLGGLWLLLFVRSRPWRRLGPGHGLLLVGLAAAWWGFFRLAVSLAGGTARLPEAEFPQPIYLFTAPGSPQSGGLDLLFLHGLVGLAWVFLVSVTAAGLRPRWTWTLAGGLSSLLLVASLMTTFYLHHGNAVFRAAAAGPLRNLRGDFFYATQEQTPFLLTDPLEYCRFQQTIDDLDEVEIRRWFKGYAGACAVLEGRGP